MIVTIDGPAGSGKSTAARRLAQVLGFHFLDTGAMYRCVALRCLRRGIDLDDREAVAAEARAASIVSTDLAVTLDGEDVSEAIRTEAVTDAASVVAVNPCVREAMVELQRCAVEGLDAVTEGRDQGSVVFPHAENKFFLTADLPVRARRRRAELAETGIEISEEEMVRQLAARDRRDANRPLAPLAPAADALIVDTSDMTIDSVVDRLAALVRQRVE